MPNYTSLFRPKSFDDILGQEHLCSKEAPLRRLCESHNLKHAFFYGPAGSGKTSLARVVAASMELDFYEFNATSLKVESLRKVFSNYSGTLSRPLIFIDEVHRLSKNQQEVLLPVMEDESVIVIGASTENPYFSLTSAIRSRSMLFELKKVSNEALGVVLDRVISHESLEITADAKEYAIASSGGDVRAMLKLVESAASLEKEIRIELLKSLRPHALSVGSSEAGVHYDLASALIKSIRGSDMDASIYYLARLIEGGESADFIARRLVILASEDIGLANPQALTQATSALSAISAIGFPEARIILSQTVLYLCSSPKSNSAYMAINRAQKMVRDGVMLDIPKNISQFNDGYLYPHDYGGYVEQKYLSKELNIVELKSIGYEKK